MWEYLAVVLIVIVAVIGIGVSFYRSATRPDGCGGCGSRQNCHMTGSCPSGDNAGER